MIVKILLITALIIIAPYKLVFSQENIPTKPADPKTSKTVQLTNKWRFTWGKVFLAESYEMFCWRTIAPTPEMLYAGPTDGLELALTEIIQTTGTYTCAVRAAIKSVTPAIYSKLSSPIKIIAMQAKSVASTQPAQLIIENDDEPPENPPRDILEPPSMGQTP